MKPSLTQLGLALCALLCGASGGAHASPGGGAAAAPQLFATQNPADVQLVGDDVLAKQTGKYAGASMISGFVLNVLSQWNLPNGVSAEARGSFSAMRDPHGHMSTSYSTQASVTGDGPGSYPGSRPGGHQGNYADNAANNWGADPNAHVSGGQSIAVNGVSQVTQVAGNSNSGTNSTLIDFSNNVAPIVGANNAASASASDPSGAVKAGISFNSNGVKVALQTPAGLATQTIAPGNGQIAQLLQIAGNNQQVANALQLHLQTQQMPTAMLRQLGVLQALQNRR